MEEPLQARIDRLGRERPASFKNLFSEVSFVFSIVMSQILTEYFTSGFALLIPSLVHDLNIPRPAVVWPATAFSLVIASTLLLFGRFGDIFGGYPVYVFGLAWLLVWSIIAGFSINRLMLDFARAFQGLGASALLATGIMLMGSIYRPGPRKNLVFALYGIFAIMGFFLGILVAGVVGEYLRWSWFFWIGAALNSITLVASIFSIPNDYSAHRSNDVGMDYPGSVLITASLVLIIFSITESANSPHGWSTPYIPSLLVVGILLLLAAIYVELRISTHPLLPSSLFTIHKAMLPLTLAIMLLYGTWGIFIIYGTQYFQNIMHASPIQLVGWYTPIFVSGFILAIAEGLVMHLIPGRIILIISAIAAVLAQLLLALIPRGGTYWAWILPATVCSTIGIDLSYIVMTVFVTTILPNAQQGLGGGVLNSVLQLGIAFCLGFAEIIQTNMMDRDPEAKSEETLGRSYKDTFWFGVGVAGLGLLLMTFWGDLPRAKSDLTADEKLELEMEAAREEKMSKNTRSGSRNSRGQHT